MSRMLRTMLVFSCVCWLSICGTEAMVVTAVEIKPDQNRPEIPSGYVGLNQNSILIERAPGGTAGRALMMHIRNHTWDHFIRCVIGGVPTTCENPGRANGVMRIKVTQAGAVTCLYNGVTLATGNIGRAAGPNPDFVQTHIALLNWPNVSADLATMYCKQRYCIVETAASGRHVWDWSSPADLNDWTLRRNLDSVVPIVEGGQIVLDRRFGSRLPAFSIYRLTEIPFGVKQ